jgi:hypothetical protein
LAVVAQRKALQLVARRVIMHAALAAVPSRAAGAAAPQLFLAALALASATAGERAHHATRTRCRAALAASMCALLGVVLLRSGLQQSNQPAAQRLLVSFVVVVCCCRLLLQRLQRTSYDSGSLVSGNKL